MTDRNDGGPAFPGIEPSGDAAYGGMSLRDWFAGMALAGALASGKVPERGAVLGAYASLAYAMANVMLEAREVEQ